jgi:hypothetical protein
MFCRCVYIYICKWAESFLNVHEEYNFKIVCESYWNWAIDDFEQIVIQEIVLRNFQNL